MFVHRCFVDLECGSSAVTSHLKSCPSVFPRCSLKQFQLISFSWSRLLLAANGNHRRRRNTLSLVGDGYGCCSSTFFYHSCVAFSQRWTMNGTEGFPLWKKVFCRTPDWLWQEFTSTPWCTGAQYEAVCTNRRPWALATLFKWQLK